MKQLMMLMLGWLPVAAFAQNGEASQTFTVSGGLKKLKDSAACVYIHYATNNNRVTDSAKVVKGSYKLSGKLSEPVIAQLQVRFKNKELANDQDGLAIVFLEPRSITVTSNGVFNNITVTGSPSHELFAGFEKQLRPLGDSMQGYYKRYMEARQQNDYNTVMDIETKAIALEKKIKDSVIKPFIINNAKSPVALMALQQLAGGGREIDVDQLEPLFSRLDVTVQQYASAVQLKERIDAAARTAMGREAADFIQNDTLDNPVKLSSFRGKYLLVDFWASWCGPCRQENPHVVEVYNKFNQKGFTVLGVSLDKPGAKDAWIKAIHDDKLTWTHVSDLQFWNNAAARLYGIESIPQNFLLDPQGRIIGKNLRGAELNAKLEEVLGN